MEELVWLLDSRSIPGASNEGHKNTSLCSIFDRPESDNYNRASKQLGVGMSTQARVRLEMLRSAPLDSWIAISEDESHVVAVGRTYSEASELADAKGQPDSIILKTPSAWEPISVSVL